MADVILRDGSTELIRSNRICDAVEITPNIPMNVQLAVPDEPITAPYLLMLLQQADDPAGSWSTIVESPMFSPLVVPLNWEAPATPTKAYLRAYFAVAEGVSAGHVTVVAAYEVMAEAVYNRLMRAKRVTEKQIEACGSQVDEHEAAKIVAGAKKAGLELEMALFDNFLSDEIAQYEAIMGGS